MLKYFKLKIAIRIIFLTLTILLCCILFVEQQRTVAIGLAIFSIYQVYRLTRFIDQTNRDLTNFFQAIKYNDFSQTFTLKKIPPSFLTLHETLGEILEKFGELRREKEEQNRYLQTVIQHVGIGILTFHSDGKVELFNRAAKQLLQLSHLKNIADLQSDLPAFYNTLSELQRGEKRLLKIIKNDIAMQLIVFGTDFLIAGEKIRLVTLQDIRSELDEKEMEAWQNLIRVLTHEIMNSVTPISSLAATANTLLQVENSDNLSNDALIDLKQSLSAIEKRSTSLLHFVETYRSLTRIPRPNFQIVKVEQLFQQMDTLYRESCTKAGIRLSVHVQPESLEITADPELVEQILINLLLNAKQALQRKKGGIITLNAGLDEGGRVHVEVADNGPGIAPENLEKIFIPFFTTKKSGRGIGLSLARQIMRLHRGNISVQSSSQGSSFRLMF